MIKNYILPKTIMMFFIVSLFYSCNEIKPKTEGECVLESRYILKIISEEDYLEKLMHLKKYETFHDYNKKDYEITYKKLHDFLKTINLNDLKVTTKKENTNLQYKDFKSYVDYFIINYSYINVNTLKEIELCKFKYSIAEKEKYFTLSYFKHDLQSKIAPAAVKQ